MFYLLFFLEGEKRWRLYNRPDSETNVTASVTKEFKQSDLGEPIADFILKPGDTMYFPRGIVHQAISSDSGHSLHLTFSTYQKNTWFDLFSIIGKENVEFQNEITKMEKLKGVSRKEEKRKD